MSTNAFLAAHATLSDQLPRERFVLAAEYILIGPTPDPDAVAQAFAMLSASPLPPPPSHDPSQTIEIPTTTVKLWARNDGSRIVEVTSHQTTDGPYYLPLHAAA
jgi:hypothetical protein